MCQAHQRASVFPDFSSYVPYCLAFSLFLSFHICLLVDVETLGEISGSQALPCSRYSLLSPHHYLLWKEWEPRTAHHVIVGKQMLGLGAGSGAELYLQVKSLLYPHLQKMTTGRRWPLPPRICDKEPLSQDGNSSTASTPRGIPPPSWCARSASASGRVLPSRLLI